MQVSPLSSKSKDLLLGTYEKVVIQNELYDVTVNQRPVLQLHVGEIKLNKMIFSEGKGYGLGSHHRKRNRGKGIHYAALSVKSYHYWHMLEPCLSPTICKA